MNIVLIGFMGSGKSTVAKILSDHLSLACLEMDALVCKKAGCKSVHEVFKKGGEPLWREIESSLGKEFALLKNHILSTGGGVVLHPLLLQELQANGAKICFLNTSFKEVQKRIEKEDSRPLFQDVSLARKLYEARLPLYFKWADFVFDTDAFSAIEVAEQIEQRIQGFHGI